MPGPNGSFPYNLTDVGGELYFTANANASKVELWRTDGTEIGTVKVKDLAVTSINQLTPIVGSPSLLSNGSTPTTGRPNLSYRFDLIAVTLSGIERNFPIELSIDSLADNLKSGGLPLASFVDDINQSLNRGFQSQGLPTSAIHAQAIGGKLEFAINYSDFALVRFEGGAELGLESNQSSTTNLILEASRPLQDSLQKEQVFSISLTILGGEKIQLPIAIPPLGGGGTVRGDSGGSKDGDEVTVSSSTSEVAAALNEELRNELLAQGLPVDWVLFDVVQRDQIESLALLSKNDPRILDLQISTVPDLGFLGSEKTIGERRLLAASALSEEFQRSGIPPVSIPTEFEFVLSNGKRLPIRTQISLEKLADNQSTFDLAADLQQALSVEFVKAKLPENAVSVSVDQGRQSLAMSLTSESSLFHSIRIAADGLGVFGSAQQSAPSDIDLYFVATTREAGSELWVSNGTADGTVMIEATPGIMGTSPFQLTPIGQTLFFVGSSSEYARNVIYRYDGEGVPSIPSGQSGFREPNQLINAGGILAFVAQLQSDLFINTDREVYQFNGSTFTRLTNIPSTTSDPTQLTWFDGRLVFAAQDASSGSTSESGRVGRELWQVRLNEPYTQTVLANIGQVDTNPYTAMKYKVISYKSLNGIPIPVFGEEQVSFPGNVVSSSPFHLTAAGTQLYLSADDGSSGRELWVSQDIADFDLVTTQVADLAPGSASSSPWQMVGATTELGDGVFFVAGGTLYWTDGTGTGTAEVPGTQGLNPYDLRAVGERVFFRSQGYLWMGGVGGAIRLDVLPVPPLPLTVHVLRGEGDDLKTREDQVTPAVYSVSKEVTSALAEFDLTSAVRNALARGETRLTVRVENASSTQDLPILLAGLGLPGRTGLEIIPRVRGLVGDLYTEDGSLVAREKSIIDMRNLEADGYYLRVYSPVGALPEDLDFSITIDAPSKATPTRRRIAIVSMATKGRTW